MYATISTAAVANITAISCNLGRVERRNYGTGDARLQRMDHDVDRADDAADQELKRHPSTF